MPYYPYDMYGEDVGGEGAIYGSHHQSAPDATPIMTPDGWRAARCSELTNIGRLRPVVGRRERALVWVMEPVIKSREAAPILTGLAESGLPLASMTYGTLMDLCRMDGDLHDLLGAIDLRINLGGIDPTRFTVSERGRIMYGVTAAKDPELHYGLQDLGWSIGHELAKACEAFSDPDVWYPGVDEGIAPVPDEHVELVIAATQRELDRELRRSRPSAPLSELPKRIQRAFAERRRALYQTWGIGTTQWKQNKWSLWDVKDDPSWLPPWLS